jgi:hypothetical protein
VRSGTAAERWPRDVLEAIGSFGQGDMFEDPPPLVYYGDIKSPLPWQTGQFEEVDPPSHREFDLLEYPESKYGVITTQTCDLNEEGRPRQPCFQACPVFRLNLAGQQSRTLPQHLAPLEPPDLPQGGWVADLRMEVSIEKSFLVGKRRILGFSNERGYLDFASRLGRRRDRAAVASELVDAVARTIKRRKANNSGFKRSVRDHVRNIRLAIDGGTRIKPTIARTHIIGRDGPVPPEVQAKFESWFEEAYAEAEASGIKLLPNEYHDGTRMNLNDWERTIELQV